MKETRKYQTDRMRLAMALLITLGVLSNICHAAKLVKVTGEVINGDVLGFIVLQADNSETEGGAPGPLYLLCEGKRASSISENGVTCEANAKVLMRVTEKPTGKGQMAVLEDAADIGFVNLDCAVEHLVDFDDRPQHPNYFTSFVKPESAV